MTVTEYVSLAEAKLRLGVCASHLRVQKKKCLDAGGEWTFPEPIPGTNSYPWDLVQQWADATNCGRSW